MYKNRNIVRISLMAVLLFIFMEGNAYGQKSITKAQAIKTARSYAAANKDENFERQKGKPAGVVVEEGKALFSVILAYKNRPGIVDVYTIEIDKTNGKVASWLVEGQKVLKPGERFQFSFPTKGAKLSMGKEYYVTWQPFDPSRQVEICLYDKGMGGASAGKSWSSGPIPDVGHYTFVVPKGQIPKETYQLYISRIKDSALYGYSPVFSIK